MKVLFAVIALLTAALADAGPECQWGPAYWCQNKETAQKCGQLQYCQQNFWKTVTPQKENADLCDICKFIVEFVDKFIDENTTESEAESLVLKLCDYLGGAASECKDLVEEFFPMIWKLLEEETDPEKVCSILGLCNSSDSLSSKKVVKKTQVTVPKTVSCDVCVLVVGEIVNLFENNNTETEIENEIKEYCSYLGPLESECKELIDEFFPEIWALLKKETDPSAICADLGLCPRSQLKVRDNGLCDTCKDICEFLQQYVDNNATKEEVKEVLEKICSLLPELPNCENFVVNDFDQLWGYLQGEVDSDTICYQFGCCSSQTRTKTKMPKSQRLSLRKPKDQLCDICKLVVNYAKPYVESNKTENEVLEYLDELCSLLPNEYQAPCNDFVKEYFPDFWKLLKEEVDGDMICFQLGICTSTSAKTTKAVSPRPKVGSELCDLCQLVINFLKPFIESNSTEEDAEKALDKFCDLLPGNLSSECTAFVDKYLPVAWTLLEAYIDDPEMVCELLKLCDSSSTATISKVPKSQKLSLRKPTDPLCDICKFVIGYLKPFVVTNTTETGVKEYLEELCSALPDNQADCASFVKEYFSQFWKLLEGEFDNDEICFQLDVCTSSSAKTTELVPMPEQQDVTEPEALQVPMPMPEQQDVTEPEALQVPMPMPEQQDVTEPEEEGILCVICEYVMEKIESLLVNNATEAEIIALVEKVCTLLPSTIRSECDEFIQEYGEEIINLLVKGEGPKVICTLIGVCLGEQPQQKALAPMDQCSLCIDVMKIIDTIIETNFTATGLEKALEYACSKLPFTEKYECEAFVKEFGDQIVQLLIKAVTEALDPDTICKALGVCSSKASALSTPWKMAESLYKN